MIGRGEESDSCQSGDFFEDCGINDRKILLGIRHSASCVCFKDMNNMKGNHKHSSSSADHTESPQHGHEV